MDTIRRPAVAGMFYPHDADTLRCQVWELLDAVPPAADPPPKALIAPHAGYIYSGPVAATVYARLRAARDTVRRVVLLGPSHRVGFRGLAASGAAAFDTPLGRIPVDLGGVQQALELPGVGYLEAAHAQEHSLEVHLPFLQETLGDFSLIPLVVGEAGAEQVGPVVEALWGGPETLVVISSDLSHYHDYRTARELDSATSRAIEELRYGDIGYEDACGRNPIAGLLWVVARKGLRGKTLDLRNSGDTAGPRGHVVGYGAYVFTH